MSQPTESPQRNWGEALDRIGSLSPESWENLAAIAQLQKSEVDRLIQRAQKVPMKDQLNQKVQNITGRVQAVYAQQTKRLSESAVVTKGRQWGNSTLDTGADLATGAVGLYQAGAEKAKAFGTAAKEEAQLFGRDMKEMGRDIKAGAKEIPGDLKALGKGVADRASRWFKTQKSRVTLASEGARATIAAMKFDKNMPQQTTTRDATQLSQRFSAVYSTDPAVRLQQAQEIAREAQAQIEAQGANAALSGMAPAGQAPAAPSATQAQSPREEHGQQKNPDRGVGKG
ncbi:hypothetical protein [Kribbella sp. NPDC049584]|uniref:hypothetical protein n=1 Tax=Kribbella sp. NPDC049584 TaxID=3154833 RepID=UPI003445A7D8